MARKSKKSASAPLLRKAIKALRSRKNPALWETYGFASEAEYDDYVEAMSGAPPKPPRPTVEERLLAFGLTPDQIETLDLGAKLLKSTSPSKAIADLEAQLAAAKIGAGKAQSSGPAKEERASAGRAGYVREKIREKQTSAPYDAGLVAQIMAEIQWKLIRPPVGISTIVVPTWRGYTPTDAGKPSLFLTKSTYERRDSSGREQYEKKLKEAARLFVDPLEGSELYRLRNK